MIFTTDATKTYSCPEGSPTPTTMEGSLGNVNVVSNKIDQTKPYYQQFTLQGDKSLIGRLFVLKKSASNCTKYNDVDPILASCVLGIANGQFIPVGNPAGSVYTSGAINQATSTSAMLTRAVCKLTGILGNNVTGWVYFDENGTFIRVSANEIKGLNMTMAHGIHIHQYGDITLTNGTSVGGHWKTGSQTHGLPPSTTRELGDLGNICAYDYNGDAYYQYQTDYMGQISGQDFGTIIGHSVVIHIQRDNGTLDSYSSRVSQCVIGYERNTNQTPLFPKRIDLSTTPQCDKITVAPNPSTTGTTGTTSSTSTTTGPSSTTTSTTTGTASAAMSFSIFLLSTSFFINFFCL